MKIVSAICSILAVCIVAPIWYYLLYKILTAIQASELTWFLFWIYIPVALLTGIIDKIARDSASK